MKAISVCVISLLILSCQEPIDTGYIQTKTWVYDEGFKIGQGDFVTFLDDQHLFELKEDTIFFQGQPRAIVVNLNKKLFDMEVKSIDGGQRGFYRDQSESISH